MYPLSHQAERRVPRNNRITKVSEKLCEPRASRFTCTYDPDLLRKRESIGMFRTTPLSHTCPSIKVYWTCSGHPSRSTDCEPISSTGGALTKIASLKKEGEQLWTQLRWAPVRDDSARMGSSARRLRQVGWSARRLRQVGWSARRLRQEPLDGPSARMKCHWLACFELSELSAESLRQVARTRKSH